MLQNPFFYHHAIRKMVVAFGNIFNDLYIHRVDENHVTQKEILVPLSYSPKEKWIYRIKQNPKPEEGNVGVVIPRMAFQMDSIAYDPARKLQSVTKDITTTGGVRKYTYTPVPYNFNFSFYLLTDTIEDATDILEQILVFFRPEYTTTVNVLPEMGLTQDVPIILNSITSEDNFDTDFEEKRLIIWTLQFTMKGYIYGPVNEQGLIRKVIANIHSVNAMGIQDSGITCEEVANSPTSVTITVEPNPIDANPDEPFTYDTKIVEKV